MALPARHQPAAVNIARQRRFWTSRAASWDHGAGNNPGLVKVVEQVIVEAKPAAGMHVLDLGTGSGQLALRFAPKVAEVRAIDVSPAMIDLLERHVAETGITNVSGEAAAIEHLAVAEATMDLVVSNYALHHLRDPDKAVLVRRAYTWLRPGGRLVVGDMMFGRGGESRDRAIISSKLALLVKKGPGGWWRIAKNAGRYLLRFQERPVSMSAWVQMFEAAGFTDVRAIPVVNEAAVVVGTRPSSA